MNTISGHIETMLETAGKAAVIHPTGTGKSYIAVRLIKVHPDSKFVWLSPSVYIFRTKMEQLLRYTPDFSVENIRFLSMPS